uniref:uncharacterized protein LOC122600345 n=1 Tax=Erigeron canadensis TaxID=72917 RepID=UPI001CB98440|nr:uncharacterized protein LOC122600345 [Erigeron canadensis]
MIRPKSFQFYKIHKLFNPHPKSLSETHLIPLIYTKSLIPISHFSRSISLSSQFRHESDTKEVNGKSIKSLEAVFKEAVGLEIEKEELTENSGKLKVELSTCTEGSMKKAKISKRSKTLFKEAIGVSKKAKSFELDQESEKGLKKLSTLFTSSAGQRKKLKNEVRKVEEVIMEYKELSPDMAVFAEYLYKKGYLINANFLPNNKFDVSCFVNNYGRDFLKFAAEKFAKDHREINKWLPDSDLKKVAQFGCPSLARKNIFSAKAMRFHFGIQEETVCNKCTLKESCKFANQSVWKKGATNIDLPVVMRVITLYALETVPTKLKVPDDVKNAANQLLKEVIRLSELES